MKIKIVLILIFIVIFGIDQKVLPITLVYNMKIRRVFDLGNILKKKKKLKWVATAVPIIYKKDRCIVESKLNIFENRLTVGSLFNLRHFWTKSFWAEVTTGIEREKLKTKGTQNFIASRTGLDDIVLSAGYNKFLGKNAQFVIYTLAGFPTHRKVTVQETQEPLVGTRFFSLGIGSEISYGFINKLKKAFILIFQNRLIHFFSRNYEPILPPDARIRPGNVIDLLFALRYRIKKNLFETGYNSTFFTNQAITLRNQTNKSDVIIRQSIYGTYAYLCKKFPILNTPGIIGAGINIGRSNKFNTKIFSCWINLSVLF